MYEYCIDHVRQTADDHRPEVDGPEYPSALPPWSPYGDHMTGMSRQSWELVTVDVSTRPVEPKGNRGRTEYLAICVWRRPLADE